MRIWEEGYVADTVAFDMMHAQMVFIVEGGPLRLPDGSLDRARILRHIDASVASLEFFRLRLQRSVLGLTPPAWVPDEDFDINRHVVFADGTASLTSENLWDLAGRSEGLMSLKHPLWRFRLTELDNGDVALGGIFHHASLDGMSAMKLLSTMTQKAPDAPEGTPQNPFTSARAATALELPWLALRDWLHEQPSFRTAWQSYWRRPPSRRLRRVGGRCLRPWRDRLRKDSSRRNQLPPRHSDFRIMDSKVVAQRSNELDGTISDLLVAAVIRSYDGADQEVSLRFPVSHHGGGAGSARNLVSDMRLHGSVNQELGPLMRSLRRQIESRGSQAADVSTPVGRQIGYATLLPWVSRPRYFCGAQITAVVPFPAGLGTDDLSAGAMLYNGDLSVTVTAQVTSDVSSIVDRVHDFMTGKA